MANKLETNLLITEFGILTSILGVHGKHSLHGKDLHRNLDQFKV